MAGESKLWIPESARDRNKVYKCLLCNTRFPEHQRAQWERHVAECSSRNEEIPEAAVAQRDDNYITGVADEEQYRYLRERSAERRT